MKNYTRLFLILFGLNLIALQAYGQECSDMDIQLQSTITTSCGALTMTSLHDQMDRPYLYIAHKDIGLTVHDIENPTSPLSVDTVPVNLFDSLHVMNLTQVGNYLYLAIGNHFTNPQAGGMAIVDVSNPTEAVVTDYYAVPGSGSGAGIVKVEGDYAYLGAMLSGLVILDVSDKQDIQLVSQFKPNIDYPVNNPSNPKLYNARGMVVQNGIVYLAYDAGGLRIINCENPAQPVQTGQYANPALYQPMNLPRAYNNLVLDDSLIYITVDYCGLEVLNVSDPSDIQLAGWWNPYGCPDNNWFESPVHTNELYHKKECDLLFVSTAESDMVVLDISEPTQPDSCNAFGSSSNNIGTWGISSYNNQLYLTYVCAVLPFLSTRSELQILEYSPCSGTLVNDIQREGLSLYPNPARNQLKIRSPRSMTNAEIRIINTMGQLMKTTPGIYGKSHIIETDDLQNGLYFMIVKEDGKKRILRFIVEK